MPASLLQDFGCHRCPQGSGLPALVCQVCEPGGRAQPSLDTWALLLLKGCFLEQELAHTKTTAKHKATLTHNASSVVPPAHPGQISWKQSATGHGIWSRTRELVLSELGKLRDLKGKMVGNSS